MSIHPAGQIVGGALLLAVAGWGGAWAVHAMHGTWAEGPAGITAILLAFAAIVVAADGFDRLDAESRRREKLDRIIDRGIR